MRTSYAQLLTTLRNAQNFLSENADALGEVNKSGAKASLDEVTATIESLAVAQGNHRMEISGARKAELRLARDLRRRLLVPIVRVTRANVPEVPDNDLALPHPNRNSTALASFTGSLLKTVEPFAPVLVKAGLPADFAARARAAADDLVKAVTGKGSHRTNRVGATDGLDKHTRQARRVLAMLEALIVAQLREGDPLLRAWRDARRIVQGGTGPVPATESSSAAPAAPPTIPPAAEGPSTKAA